MLRSRYTFKNACYTQNIRRSRQPVATCRAATAGQASMKQLLTRRSYAPPRFVGPIQVSEVPGKRYGLTATQNLPVGSLLLLVPALVAAYGPSGAAPSNAELVSPLDGQQLQPWQMQWLRALYREPAAAVAADSSTSSSGSSGTDGLAAQQQLGSAAAEAAADGTVDLQQPGATAPADALAGNTAAQQQQQQDPNCQQLALLQQLLLEGDSSAAAPEAAVSVASVLCPFSTEQLQQVIAENAYSEATEDLGAALLRELDPEGVTGLWPEYSLLNHSCAPNTVAVVVGQYLLLRAVAPVLQGEELTGSYLGKLGFSPVAQRRAYLSGVYGFHCQCERCMAEQSTFPTVYYPADNALLGVVDPDKPFGSSSSDSSSDAQQQQDDAGIKGLVKASLDKVLGLLGLGSGAAGSSKSQQQQQQPKPSAQHMLLLQLHAVAEELAAAVQEAVAADSRRHEQQLALLGSITEKIEGLLQAVSDVAPQLEQHMQQSPQLGAKWLLAAAYPLLQLQVELIELLLASGELPVDDKHLVYDSSATGSSGGSGGGSRYMATAGAAAAARLSSSRRKKLGGSRSSQQGLGGWLSGWRLGLQQDAGPVTKRQLLAVYVEALERCLAVVDSVGRGSEVHVVLSLKHMDAARQLYGVEAEETRLAEGLCSRAHAARYGVMRGDEQQLLAALISARRRQLLGVSLARKMSVMAWEGSIARQ